MSDEVKVNLMPAYEVPESFIREFMKHRHFWAAHEINIVARKDGKEYQLDADWLKPFIRALAQ